MAELLWLPKTQEQETSREVMSSDICHSGYHGEGWWKHIKEPVIQRKWVILKAIIYLVVIYVD